MGVFGAGNMGVNHLRILSEMDSVDLVGVYDPDATRATVAAETYDCRALPDPDALAGEIDAACIVTPSSLLAQTGQSLLERGIHCLVEKPFAVTPEEGAALVDAAEKKSAILMPGFIERFNPAVQALRDVLPEDGSLYALEARRMSATSGRIRDIDVILDLMVHDLDITLSLFTSDIADIAARGMTAHPDSGADFVNVAITFADGSLASLTASRITHRKIRSLQISAAQCLIDLDYITQQVRVSRQGDLQPPEVRRSGNYVLDMSVDQVLVTPSEPLMLELRHFVRCIQKGEQPEVTGADAMRTLDAAWRIKDALASTRWTP